MDDRNNRRPARGTGRHSSAQPVRRRREPLQDHYYYEEPPRGRTPESFEDISSYSSPSKRRADQLAARRPVKRKRPGSGKRAAKTLALLCVLLVVVGGLYVFWYMLSGLTMTKIDRDSLAVYTAHSDPDITNIALFGLDAREDENEGRSDALMILTIDNKHHKLKLTSILRDSQVYIDGYGYDKITHAYAYGGPELSIRTLNQNFYLDIADYVTVNFVEMAQIVDAFGGVEMDLTGEEKAQVNQNLWDLAQESGDSNILKSDFFLNAAGTADWANGEYFDPGHHLLNGNQAVAFARIRYLEGGDDVRASRQQLVLQGLISQMKGKSKLAYPALVHNIVPMCETSLGYMSMMSLAPFVLTDFSMETLTVPGAEENAYGDYNDDGAWVYLYDTEAAAAHIQRFIYE